MYRNEAEVVAAVANWRKDGGAEDVWLTSKVVGKEHATEKCVAAVDESVEMAKAGGLEWVRRTLCSDRSDGSLYQSLG